MRKAFVALRICPYAMRGSPIKKRSRENAVKEIHLLFTIVLCAVLIGADQVFKLLAVRFLQPIGDVTVIPGVVGLSYVENTGAAFNIFAGQQILLIVVTGAVLLFGAYILLFRRPKDWLEYTSIIMVFSGGVGNLIDRVANGYVVDYIRVLFMEFAIFNFADILVCVGFGLLVIAVFRAESRAKKQAEAEKAQMEQDATTPPTDDGDGPV
ncbi:signal peptidase II [Clostridia bacterium OttesenSCG-928-O13]|nr:signal peptidase II [Clostridia bacterium OttesenSCG-928-O13]